MPLLDSGMDFLRSVNTMGTFTESLKTILFKDATVMDSTDINDHGMDTTLA